VVGIAASGRTPFTVAAVALARKRALLPSPCAAMRIPRWKKLLNSLS